MKYLDDRYNKYLNEINMPVYLREILNDDGIYLIGDLCSKKESHASYIPKIGASKLNKLKCILEENGLHFGMKVQTKEEYMNLNKIVKDSVSSIKNRYDNTQLNPFKVPDKITIKVDLAGSYADLLTAIENMDEQKVARITTAFTKLGNIVEKAIENKLEKGKK